MPILNSAPSRRTFLVGAGAGAIAGGATTMGLDFLRQGPDAVASKVTIVTGLKGRIEAPFDYYGVLGDGSSSDFGRLTTALQDAANVGLPLRPKPGKTYNIPAMIVPPNNTRIRSQRSSPFVFHASDAFTSQNRPVGAGGASENCIYAVNCDDFHVEGLKLVFDRGTRKNSWVNGLAVRGGRGMRLRDIEATGFNSGYLLALDSVRDFFIDGYYAHDCLQQNDGTTGGGNLARSAQTTGIQWDDNKLNDGLGNPIGSSAGNVSNVVIRNLQGDAATRAIVGYQTDALNPPLYSNHINFSNIYVESVDEGIDFSGGSYHNVSGAIFKDISYFALKLLYGAKGNTFNNIMVDGFGCAAIILFRKRRLGRHSGKRLQRNQRSAWWRIHEHPEQ
jgi:hypothetical protein